MTNHRIAALELLLMCAFGAACGTVQSAEPAFAAQPYRDGFGSASMLEPAFEPMAITPANPQYFPQEAASPVEHTDDFSHSPLTEPFPDGDAPRGSLVFVGYDAFRGVPDGSWENNGIHVGLNHGTRLGSLSEATGIGFQAGGSVGVYDWSGTNYRAQNSDQAETQGFFTYGLFRRATAEHPLSAALVNDWMFNQNFGVLAADPTLTQLRGQVAYAVSASDELGLWGTCKVNESVRPVPIFGEATYAPVDLLSAFWHRHWLFGGDTWVYVGMPEHTRLTHDGSLGAYYVNASANLPLSHRAAIYTSVMYMAPSSRPGATGSNDEAWNFTVGLAFYPRRNAYCSTVYGRQWMPLMPVASNGSFLVDTNSWY
jgi:hypothetical protein